MLFCRRRRRLSIHIAKRTDRQLWWMAFRTKKGGYLPKDTWRELLGALLGQLFGLEKENAARCYTIRTEYRYEKLWLDDIIYGFPQKQGNLRTNYSDICGEKV